MITLKEDHVATWFDYRFSEADDVEAVYGDPGPVFRDALERLPRSAAHAVDVACGDGRYAIPMAQAGLEVTAYDFLPVALERVRKRAQSAGCASRISVERKRVSKLPDAEGNQDFVVCGSCNLHLWGREQATDALEWFERAIGNEGVLFVCVSSNIKRVLPTGEKFKYDTEADYSKDEALELIEDYFESWDYSEVHTRRLEEEWDIPHKLREKLGSDNYRRTEEEITLVAEK